MNEKNFVTKEEFDATIDTLLVLNDQTNKRIDDMENRLSRQTNLWGIIMTLIGVLFAGMQIGIAIILYFLK